MRGHCMTRLILLFITVMTLQNSANGEEIDLSPRFMRVRNMSAAIFLGSNARYTLTACAPTAWMDQLGRCKGTYSVAKTGFGRGDDDFVLRDFLTAMKSKNPTQILCARPVDRSLTHFVIAPRAECGAPADYEESSFQLQANTHVKFVEMIRFEGVKVTVSGGTQSIDRVFDFKTEKRSLADETIVQISEQLIKAFPSPVLDPTYRLGICTAGLSIIPCKSL